MSDNDNTNFNASNKCYYCCKDFNTTNFDIINDDNTITELDTSKCLNPKVRDHDHLSDKYRGASHYNCNINDRSLKDFFIPLYFHNGSFTSFVHIFLKIPNFIYQKQLVPFLHSYTTTK